jgi:hypothetical protein
MQWVLNGPENITKKRGSDEEHGRIELHRFIAFSFARSPGNPLNVEASWAVSVQIISETGSND